MPVLLRDVESRSTLDLKKVGAWKYAGDPTTDVLCIAFAVDDGPIELWLPGQPIPEEFFTAARDPDWLVVAHNDFFESAIEERLLAPRYKWPLVPIERHRCTLAATLANALPGELGAACHALGLPGKDAEGRRLMLQMSKPRKPRKGDDPTVIQWLDDPERRERLGAYCKRDVEIERALFRRLPPLSESEQALWQLDAQINRRGFAVDVELAAAARELSRATLVEINHALDALTDGRVTSVSQVARIEALVKERGHKIQSLGKRNVAAVLAAGPGDEIGQLLRLRQEGGKASANKLETLLAAANDGRLHGTMRYHGAATGRWSGSGFQPHNLARAQPDDPDAAIAAVLSGELERVRAIGPPLAVIGSLSRSMICAAPGCELIGGDFSGIEARVTAWLAGEEWLLDTYRRYDESGDPQFDPYCITASKILHRPVTPAQDADRQLGKMTTLAFGFGGGAGAFKRINPDADFTDAQIESFKAQWRNAHPKICQFWRRLHIALIKAVRTKAPVAFQNFSAAMRDGNLYLKLPSGRELVYPEAHLVPGAYEDLTIVFKDNAMGAWRDVSRSWHGLFVENVVQAIARDLLAGAMLKLEAAGYPIVLHVHDEIICEVREGAGELAAFKTIVTTLPGWAAGLPLVAKASRRHRYAEESPAAVERPAGGEAEGHRSTGAPEITHQRAPSAVVPALPATPEAHFPAAAAIVPVSPIETLDERLARISLPDLVGDSGLVHCPFHDDNTPSCHIYEDHFYCFGCQRTGNHLDWLRDAEGMSDDAAFDAIMNWQAPAARPRREAGADRKRALALQLWARAVPIAGTPAIDYLGKVRRIDVDALPTDSEALRFHPNCPFGRGRFEPCLLALFRDIVTDAPVGIHRVMLTPDVFAGEKVQRRMLGARSSPSAIKLWPAADRLFVGEGIETVLAAATRLTHHGAPMRPAWAAGSTDQLGKFAIVPGVAQLVILADNDLDGAGADAAAACQQLWRATGREASRLMPAQPGTDFNDLVLAKLQVAA